MVEVPMVVDIYHGDSVESFVEARQAGLRAVIHKATTGATGRDRKYTERRNQAVDAGLLWGAYHWGTAVAVSKQLDNFLRKAQPDEHTLVALDFEPTPGNQMTLDQARAFLEGIAERLGRKAVIYSGHLIKEQLGSRRDTFFGSHRLWLAQYDTHPVVQRSWAKYWLWQYTDGKPGTPDPKKVPGISGNGEGHLDCDRYDGTFQQLKAEWAG
jgi:lysozyme